MVKTQVVATANSTAAFSSAAAFRKDAGKRYVSVDIVLPWRNAVEPITSTVSMASERQTVSVSRREKLAA